MQKSAIARTFSAVCLIVAVDAAGCAGGAEVLGPIVLITASYEDTANVNHRFSFQDNNPDGAARRAGSFTGFEVNPFPEPNFDLTGTLSADGTLRVTVQRTPPVTYTGRWSSDGNRLLFTSPRATFRRQ